MGGMDKSTKGRLGATILGGAIAVATGGAPWVGYLIGGLVGTYLFPTEYEEPDKYNKIGLNTTAAGLPIPLVYGTARVQGQYIWKGKLESEAIKADSGSGGGGGGGLSGSGGKPTVGYNYFLNAALGLCRGKAFCSRMWQNNNLINKYDDTITHYYGTQDQTVDPVIDAATDGGAVAYRGLTYDVLDRFPTGEGTPQAPVILNEVNRYPFNSNAGAQACVYNPVFDFNTDSYPVIETGYNHFVRRFDDGRVMVVGRYALRIYNSTMTELEKTIDLSTLLNVSGSGLYDALVIKGEVNKVVLCTHREEFPTQYDGRYQIWLMILDIDRVPDGYVVPAFGTSAGQKQYFKWQGVAFEDKPFNTAQMAYNDLYIYMVYTSGTITGEKAILRRFNMPNVSGAGGYQTYDLTSVLELYYSPFPPFHPISIAVSNQYIIIGNSAKLYSFDVDTVSLIDEWEFGSYTPLGIAQTWAAPLALNKGADEIYQTISQSGTNPQAWLYVAAILEDGTFENRGYFDIISYWINDLPIELSVAPNVDYGNDGTLLIGWRYSSTAPLAVLCLITDCNPAQMFYDLMVVERRLPESKINLPSVVNLSEYCFDNRIGVSGAIAQFEPIANTLRNLMTYVQGSIFQNNDGEFEISVFKNTDPVENDGDPITEDDIVSVDVPLSGGSGSVNRDFNKFSVTLKDRKQCANRVKINYIDRLRKYRNASFEVDHFLAQEEQEEIIKQEIDCRFFSNVRTAGRQAWRYLKQSQYDDKMFDLVLRSKYLNIKMGKVYKVELSTFNLDVKIRILSIDEPPLDSAGSVGVTAKIEVDHLNSFEEIEFNESGDIDTAIPDPTEVTPLIFEQTSLHNDDVLTLCLSCIRQDLNTAGVDVYVSEDGSTYFYLKRLGGFATVGRIVGTVDPAERNIEVDLDGYIDTFASASISEQRNKTSFCVVGEYTDGQVEANINDFEFLTFREVEPTTGDQLLLKNCYRDKYYTKAKEHDSNDIVAQFGVDRYVKYQPAEPKVGRTIYIKMQPFNIAAERIPLDDIAPFEYTIKDYTRKATHAAALQIMIGGVGQRGLTTVQTTGTPNRNVTIGWRNTARNGGISRTGIAGWTWNSFISGDRNNYDLLVYDATKTLVATREEIGNVFTYTYTETMNIEDFGSFTDEFYLGVRPRNGRGSVPDVDKILIKIDP